MKLSGFPKALHRNGAILRHVILEDAQKEFGVGTEITIAAWDSKEGVRMVGWIVDPDEEMMGRNLKVIEKVTL